MKRTKTTSGLAVLATLTALAIPSQAQAANLKPAMSSITGQLKALTCSNTVDCWAVGTTTTYDGTGMSVHWDGRSWQEVATPAPPQSRSSLLDGVSCVNANNCMAVGYYNKLHGAGTYPYAEHWDGRAWSEEAMPYPPNPRLPVTLMRAVSCPEPKLCYAAGGTEVSSGQVIVVETSESLLERWNGHTWKTVPSPALANSGITDLQGISCANADTCWATGDWLNFASSGSTAGVLGYHLVHHHWTAVKIQNVQYRHGGADLYAVSCAAASACLGIGAQAIAGNLVPYSRWWNGSSWSGASPPAKSGAYSTITGVSCATPRMCMAVGGVAQNGNFSPLAWRWNGMSWTITPKPAGDSSFAAVACPRPNSCWAVRSPSSGKPFERWNGTTWTTWTAS